MIALQVGNERRRPRSGRIRFLLRCALILMPLAAGAEVRPVCVRLEKDGTLWQRMDAAPGEVVRLSFQHSLYASRVEEIFQVMPTGFRLIELRYAEPHLAEFYGHDSARYENGLWIVKPTRALFASLNLRVSSDATILLSFGAQRNRSELTAPNDSAVGLTIADCKAD